MNVNSDEPSSSSSISSAERREQRKRERENRASSEGPGSSGQVIARPKRRPGPLDLSRLFAWKFVFSLNFFLILKFFKKSTKINAKSKQFKFTSY